jgi:hypothetical protein
MWNVPKLFFQTAHFLMDGFFIRQGMGGAQAQRASA